jgi:hypothetical protein
MDLQLGQNISTQGNNTPILNFEEVISRLRMYIPIQRMIILVTKRFYLSENSFLKIESEGINYFVMSRKFFDSLIPPGLIVKEKVESAITPLLIQGKLMGIPVMENDNLIRKLFEKICDLFTQETMEKHLRSELLKRLTEYNENAYLGNFDISNHKKE